MYKKIYKKIAIWVLIAVSSLFILLLVIFIINFPKYYPEQTLTFEEKLTGFFEKITLPIKIASLTVQSPDQYVLMPVYGRSVSQIADTWMAPREEGRIHEGQDIFAPKGTPVLSGTGGYITWLANGKVGGNSVSIVGAGGRRYYYAHLDRFANGLRVGQKISTDTIIGFVGNTGNAETTPSHLHFGIYSLRKPINPLLFLINRP